MDDKYKSKKLFVVILVTVITVLFIAAEVFTFNEKIFPDTALIVLIGGWLFAVMFYLLGQSLIDRAEKLALKWIEKKA